MKKFISIGLCLMLVGCISAPRQQYQQPFNVNQPIDMNLIEHQEQLFVLGSLSSTSLGKHIGEYMSKMREKDRSKLANVFETQQMGLTKRWFNEENETVFAVTPTRNHHFSDGSVCKEYSIETQQHNDIREFHGRACKQDGNWVIVN
jgi:surface antigen